MEGDDPWAAPSLGMPIKPPQIKHAMSFTLSSTWRQTLEDDEFFPSDDDASDATDDDAVNRDAQLVRELSSTGWKEAVGMSELQPMRRSKQWHAVEEILRTEEEYCVSLKHVVTNFVTPLLVLAQNAMTMRYTPPLSLASIRGIFQNIESVSTVHAELLARLRSYQRAAGQASSPRRPRAEEGAVSDAVLRARILMICRAFEDILPFLNMYKSYASGFDAAQTALAEIPEAARIWIEEQEAGAHVKWPAGSTTNSSQPLSSLLIRPIQRIPRYKMLFDALHKRTDADDVELRHVIVTLMNGVRKIAGDINDEVRARENRAKVYAIQQSMQKKVRAIGVDLAQPHRWFISECECRVFCPPRSGVVRDGLTEGGGGGDGASGADANLERRASRLRLFSVGASPSAPRVAKLRRVVLFNDCILIDRRRQVDILPLRNITALESETVGGGVSAPSWARIENAAPKQLRRLSFLPGGARAEPAHAAAGSIYARLVRAEQEEKSARSKSARAAAAAAGEAAAVAGATGDAESTTDEIEQFIFIGQSADRAFTEWLLALNLVVNGRKQRSFGASSPARSREGSSAEEEEAPSAEGAKLKKKTQQQWQKKKQTRSAAAPLAERRPTHAAPRVPQSSHRPISVPPRPRQRAQTTPQPALAAEAGFDATDSEGRSVSPDRGARRRRPLSHAPTLPPRALADVVVDAQMCDSDEVLTPGAASQVLWAVDVTPSAAGGSAATARRSSAGDRGGRDAASLSKSAPGPARRSLSSAYRERKSSGGLNGRARAMSAAEEAESAAGALHATESVHDERRIALDIQASLSRTRRKSETMLGDTLSRTRESDLDPTMFSRIPSMRRAAFGAPESVAAPGAVVDAVVMPSEADAAALADALGRTPAEAYAALLASGGNMNAAAESLLRLVQVKSDETYAKRLSRRFDDVVIDPDDL